MREKKHLISGKWVEEGEEAKQESGRQELWLEGNRCLFNMYLAFWTNSLPLFSC